MHGRKDILTIVVAAAWLTGACARSSDRVTTGPGSPERADAISKPGEAGDCDAEKARWAVGERASEELLERAQKAAGAKSARFLKPDQPVTLEYLASRLNLDLDKQGLVRAVRCG